MNQAPPENRTPPLPPQHSANNVQLFRGVLSICIRYILPVAVLAAGVLITLLLLKSGPQPKPRPSRAIGVRVETIDVRLGTYPTQIQAMGVVKAARSVEISPQVSGQVIEISENLVPGSRFSEAEVLLQLDPTDYQLLFEQQKNLVIRAENDLALEQGKQLVAKQEFTLLDQQVSEAEQRLMLRQPQLSTLQTALLIAQAQKDQAQLNLERTTIRAPFDGIIDDLNVNIGSWVGSSSRLATIVGSQRYWIEAAIPQKELQWVMLPTEDQAMASRVRIYNPSAWGPDTFREGQVIQLLPRLGTQDRMARVLIAVTDPLAQTSENAGKPQLLIDSYVRLEITGKPLEDAVQLPRQYLRDGDTVWLYSDQATLTFRPVTIGFKNQDQALLIGGITSGDRVIISDIATPIAGMALQNSARNHTKTGPGAAAGQPKPGAAANYVEQGGDHE